jgi:ADP-ribose pyrophosphatase YjhB (NUDIX family)
VAVQEVAVVVSRGQRVLLVQRPDEGRWAGLWEFPHAPVEADEMPDDAVARFLLGLTGVRAEVRGDLLTLRHAVTRHRITLVCVAARYVAGLFRSTFYRHGKWVRPGELASYPVSAPQRRLAEAVVRTLRQPRLF